MKENGSAGLVALLIVAVFGAVASGTITGLEKGKVKIDKEVVAARQAVDYSKMND